MQDELIEACQDGDLEAVKRLVNAGAVLNQEDGFFDACSFGNYDVARWIYSVKPAVVDACAAEVGISAACREGDMLNAEWLLSLAPKSDLHRGWCSAFTSACAAGNVRMAKWVLSHDPNIDVGDVRDNCFWHIRHDVRTYNWIQRHCPQLGPRKIKTWKSARALQLCTLDVLF